MKGIEGSGILKCRKCGEIVEKGTRGFCEPCYQKEYIRKSPFEILSDFDKRRGEQSFSRQFMAEYVFFGE